MCCVCGLCAFIRKNCRSAALTLRHIDCRCKKLRYRNCSNSHHLKKNCEVGLRKCHRPIMELILQSVVSVVLYSQNAIKLEPNASIIQCLPRHTQLKKVHLWNIYIYIYILLTTNIHMREKFILGKQLDNVLKGSLRIQLSNIILLKNRLWYFLF